MSMTLISLNVGRPIEVEHGGTRVSTGIFKHPVSGPVMARRLNLDGDGQADLVSHGGVNKAVYAYSLDHYAYWREQLGRDVLEPAQFGENFTVAGLDEAHSCVGDQLRVGDALFTITQPRVPCYKLGIRLGDGNMPKMFALSRRTGFYLRVLQEGLVSAGDTLHLVARGHGDLSIRQLFDAYLRPNDRDALHTLARALEVPELSAEWRGHIGRRLAQHAGSGHSGT